ncbi:MAG: type VI secretion system contractile sheath large subunit [Pirellulaceae bacterium]|nr:type VI secretion system contractile sheath large subunit [Pirellulaceae bacterium]
MTYSLNLGVMKAALPARAAGGKEQFRLAILGDFSGRALSGKLETGADLAKRKPLSVDVDNLDDVLARMGIKLMLPVGAGGGAVEIAIGSMDDFHPDQLYDNVEVFSGIAGLRGRLKTTSTFAKAAAEVQSWLGMKPEEGATVAIKSRGSAVPADCKLSDFAQLTGQARATEETPINELLKQVVGPHIVPAKDPKQDKLLAAVDAALSETMRSILHHPDFQALESAWRSVEFLVRRLETGSSFKIVLYDISAEEMAADLSSASDLSETGLFKLLVEQPALDAQQGPLSALVSNYFFEQTPPHADLLGRLARIAAAAQAPFLAAIGVDALKKLKDEEIHPLVLESWSALRSLPESVYVGLTVPRFMLRNPYGEKTDPIDKFDFEEFSAREGIRGMLWGSGTILAGLFLGQTFLKAGAMKKMSLGSILSVNEMPYYYFTDADGDQVALPCTERLVSVDLSTHVTKQCFMPILAIKGKPEVRLGGFQSLLGKPLAGPWAPVVITPSGVAAPAAAPAAEAAPAAVEAPAPAPEAAAAADAELDALLASLGGGDTAPAPAAAPAADAGGAEEMDPALAALLADL